MALFNAPRQSSKSFHQPRSADPLPHLFTKLKRDCHAHFGPVPMRHIGWGTSDSGQPMAVYACPVCNKREAWVRDYRTGRPHLLFTTPGR